MSATFDVPVVTRDLYRQMVLIRIFETEAERQYKAARIGGYCHLSSGQEATSVGAVHAREDEDLLCELGDGAANMGAWHESLNLAALWELPVVFLVVNNGYGMGTSVERASAEPELHRRAAAFRMPGERVDGDDLEVVKEACTRLLAAAREQRRPSLLEAVTYRFRGHSVADAGLAYRSREEISAREAADPLVRARERLLLHGAARGELEAVEREVEAVEREVEEQVRQAVAFAQADPEPPLEQLAAGIHAPGSAEQFAACDPGALSARSGSPSTRVSVDERRRRRTGERRHDLPRGAAARAARGARAGAFIDVAQPRSSHSRSSPARATPVGGTAPGDLPAAGVVASGAPAQQAAPAVTAGGEGAAEAFPLLTPP